MRPRAAWRLLDPDILDWFVEGSFDEKLLRDLMELRDLIEPSSAYYAAKRATPRECATLRSVVDEMLRTVGDPDAFSEADCDFHSGVLRACHNDVLEQLDEAVAAALRATRRWLNERASEEFGADMLKARVGVHTEVLDAIVKHEPELARNSMQRLIGEAAHDLEHRIAATDGRTQAKRGR